MTRIRGRFSIRTVLDLIIGTMGLLLIVSSVYTLDQVVGRARAVSQVAGMSSTSRDLLRTLQAVRLERGILSPALVALSPINPDGAVDVASSRATSEDGYAAIVAALDGSDILGMRSTAAELRTAHDAVAVLRPGIDAAVRQSKGNRNAQFEEAWGRAIDTYLQALTSATDRLDGAMKLVDPVLDHLLLLKRAAWTARLNAGASVLPIQSAITTGRPWTPVDTQTVADLNGRASYAWSLVEEASARPDTHTSIVEAVRAARANFEGPAVERRKAILADLAEGRRPAADGTELRRQDTENHARIVDAALVAVEQMVFHSQEVRKGSLFDAAVATLLVIAAVALSAVGFLVAHARISGPIRRMTHAMRRLADLDMSVAIPGLGRGDEIGGMAGAVVVFRDNMIKRQEAEELLRRSEAEKSYLAEHDALTGLPNRRRFLDRLGAAVERARQSGTGIALMFIDLDGFKQVNDLHGHACGDQVLQAVATRIADCVREQDAVARIGGDEFTVVLEGITTPLDAGALADRIIAAASVTVETTFAGARVGASVGIAFYPSDGATVDELLAHADVAMYRAKIEGRGRHCRAIPDTPLRGDTGADLKHV